VALDAELGDRRVRVVEGQPNPHGVAIEIDPQSGVVRVVVGPARRRCPRAMSSTPRATRERPRAHPGRRADRRRARVSRGPAGRAVGRGVGYIGDSK
jgi:hypothetical protein